MAEILSAVFDDRLHAERAVRDLQNYGVPDGAITVIAHRHEHDAAHDEHPAHEHGAGTDAVKGLGIGAVAGALFGLASIFIPGLGPIIMAGGLVSALGAAGGTVATTALVGGTAGTIAGALSHWGVSDADAHHYAGVVERGGTYVGIDTAHAHIRRSEVMEILRAHGGEIERNAIGIPDAVGAQAVAVPGETRVPLMEEAANVRRNEMPVGDVALTKRVDHVTEHVEEPVARTQVTAQTHQLSENEKYIPNENVAAIRPGETLRVPVVEEELVVQRVPRVTKEVVVTAQPQTEVVQQDVQLRKERVDVQQHGDVEYVPDRVDDTPMRRAG